MLVYDVTHEKSFENIRNWIRNIEEVRRMQNVAEGQPRSVVGLECQHPHPPFSHHSTYNVHIHMYFLPSSECVGRCGEDDPWEQV